MLTSDVAISLGTQKTNAASIEMIDLGVDVEGIDNVGPKVRRGIERFLVEGAQMGQNVAMEHVPEDRSNLRLSMAQFEPEVRDGDVVWGVGNQPHALPQEFGTDPGHTPPIKPLREWVERNNLPEGFEWYVQNKIKEEGLSEQPYLRPGAEAQSDWYSSHDISDYIKDEING